MREAHRERPPKTPNGSLAAPDLLTGAPSGHPAPLDGRLRRPNHGCAKRIGKRVRTLRTRSVLVRQMPVPKGHREKDPVGPSAKGEGSGKYTAFASTLLFYSYILI
uniref:Uncharacterized protein n=1 Tax=Chlamydomonas leiostraca TaxID=1034604 RepID=A0A1L2M545_9CHLO|nr:hypothetical protein [Chlamydomonas leiostraca]APD80587.1 hypothetical protein [Chlamydomonas leiostraca]